MATLNCMAMKDLSEHNLNDKGTGHSMIGSRTFHEQRTGDVKSLRWKSVASSRNGKKRVEVRK